MSPSVSRRHALRIGAFGSLFSLSTLLRAGTKAAASATPNRPKSAVLIFLSGAPSHLDTYDPKPDAPVEFRGEFASVATNVPGVRIAEHFPLQARMLDKLAILRAVVPTPSDEHHDVGVMTGYSPQAARAGGHPSFGAVVSRVRGMARGMPPFFTLRGMTAGCEPGMLGAAHRPFAPTGPTAADLRRPSGVSLARYAERRELLSAFDTVRRDLDASGSMAAMDVFHERAFDIMASNAVRDALNTQLEPETVLERYRGIESFLTARRLVEAGAGCVTLAVDGWDTHQNNFRDLRQLMPRVDRGVSNLLQDLDDRGLTNDVVTVVWGEFGRTPRVNRASGRDHWLPVMSAVVAGGGLRMGQVIGASSARGEEPREGRYSVSQVLATLYRAIGIDPAMTFPNASGRPVHVLEDREPIRELV
jgi:uncharacterized protein (DUF1501 family)